MSDLYCYNHKVCLNNFPMDNNLLIKIDDEKVIGSGELRLFQ